MRSILKSSDPQEVASVLGLARIQVARAKSNLDSAKQDARLAKWRRKEATQASGRARNGVKHAKGDLAEAEQFLVNIEARFAQSWEPKVSEQGEARTRPKAGVALRF